MSLAERLSKIERPDHTTEVRNRVQGKLVESLGPKLYDATLSDKDLQELVHRRLRDLLDEEQIPLSAQEKALIPPLAVHGAALTVRKFATDPYTAEDLVQFGTRTPPLVELLDACVKGRINALVSGGTGAGKTTTLNVLSSFVPDNERIITIEDSAELRLQQPHIVSLEYRPPNIEGKGEV